MQQSHKVLIQIIKTLCDRCMCCFIDGCIFKFKENDFPQVFKTWEGSSKFVGKWGWGMG